MTTTGIKIKTIRAGETVILPSNIKIIKTIVTNGSVSSSCSSQNLNPVSEPKVKYALPVDWMDELGKEDELIGLGFNGQEYLFPEPLNFHLDMKTWSNGEYTVEAGPCTVNFGLGGTGDNCIGMVKVFKFMKTQLPGGDALFSFSKYQATRHTGPSNELEDNMFLQSVEFYSYASVVENRNFFLIRRNQPGSSEAVNTYYNNSDKQISYIFPIKVDVDD